MPTNRILAVVTNAGEYERKGYRTGLWLGELTHALDAFDEAGFTYDIASPQGGYTPLDPESLNPSVMDKAIKARYEDRSFMDRLKDTKRLADVRPEDYDAIFLAGGHGTMFDFPNSPELAQLAARMFDAGKPVSAVCHGPAGLLESRLAGGTPLLQGRKATGFSWKEEEGVGRDDVVPFDLEQAMKDRGADYTKAMMQQSKKVVTDGHLVTGQNPASARGVGDEVVQLLQAKTEAAA